MECESVKLKMSLKVGNYANSNIICNKYFKISGYIKMRNTNTNRNNHLKFVAKLLVFIVYGIKYTHKYLFKCM